MLDLSDDAYRLHATSGPSQFIRVEAPHLPILQQGSQRWQDIYGQREADEYVLCPRFKGRHLVLDLPVPPRLSDGVASLPTGLQQRYHAPARTEFSHVRYTPVTCAPEYFIADGYQLMPQLFVKPRQVELCIAVTMYNEDQLLLGNTLAAIHENIRALQEPNRPFPWGPNSWQKIVVCIISDGRTKINPRSRALMASLGLYQDSGLLNKVDGQDVVAHLFEHTTHSVIRVRGGRVSVDHDPPDVTPCQTIFCLKDKNQRKVNSHSWFINGVCGVLNPTVAVFLEAGTIPQPDSLYALCAPLYQNSTVAATTGFCRVFAYSKVAEQLNPIVGFQKFEYQLNNALDRPLESLLGRRFSMNKGGYSAYRFSATAPSETESGAFGRYFDGEKITRENGIIQKNSALTEDRVIASSLLRLDRKVWRVVSVDTAQVAIDVPGTMEEFCLQRRRWICGEFFSTLREMAVVASTPPPVWNVTSIFRLVGLLIGTVYQALNLILQFLAVGNLFAIFQVVSSSLEAGGYLGVSGHRMRLAVSYLYLFIFQGGLICSLGNRPAATKLYTWLSILWVLLYAYFFSITIYLVVKSSQAILDVFHGSWTQLLTGSLFVCLVWPLALLCIIWLVAPLTLGLGPHSASSCIWYAAVLPVYINLISTYAWCNIHDVGWGMFSDSKPDILPTFSSNIGLDVDDVVLVKDTDEEGNLVLRGYTEYLGKLDRYLHAQELLCSGEEERHKHVISSLDSIADRYQNIRTMVVLLWLCLNSTIVMVVLNVPAIARFTPTEKGGEGLIYVGVVVWAYAGIAVIQYGCSCLYAISKLRAYL